MLVGRADALHAQATRLIDQSVDANQHMDRLLDVAGSLHDLGTQVSGQIDDGVDELAAARRDLADVAQHVPEVADAAEGIAKVERAVGLID